MTDHQQELEQLKQQLYAKSKLPKQPEQPPSDRDLLKYSELPTYEKHQRLCYQTQQQWMQSPEQGAIPSVPSDSGHLEVVQENLLDALNYLQFSHHYLESSGLSKQYSQLYAAVADSLNSCNEAIESCSDQPDA